MKQAVALLRQFPFWLRTLWFTGFFLFFFGGGLNLLVISANDGRMPVPVTAEEFYVIYPRYYRVALEVTPDHLLLAGKASGYSVMTERSRLKPLANRFYLVTPINIWKSLPSALTIQFIRSDVPVLGQEMQASIGDMVIWLGDLFMFLAAMITIGFMLTQRIAARLLKKYQR